MTTDPPASPSGKPADVLTSEALAKKGPEFAVALDIDRHWANAVQAFINPEISLIVFREQIVGVTEDGNSQNSMQKNVVSVAVPTSTLREFHELLGRALAGGENEEN